MGCGGRREVQEEGLPYIYGYIYIHVYVYIQLIRFIVQQKLYIVKHLYPNSKKEEIHLH